QVRDIVEYFPTLNPSVGNIVVNYEHLREAAALVDFPQYTYPTELWVDFKEGVGREQQTALGAQLGADREPRLAEWVVQEEAVRTAQSDPTLQAAGSGI